MGIYRDVYIVSIIRTQWHFYIAIYAGIYIPSIEDKYRHSYISNIIGSWGNGYVCINSIVDIEASVYNKQHTMKMYGVKI
jgi:hypothetical protein